MIDTIGVVVQGPNDLGFLNGLRDRLGCRSVVVEYPNAPMLRQRGSHTRRSDAQLLWTRVAPRVTILVRLTDGDVARPARVCRQELQRFPDDAASRLIVGVCERDVEHLMCLDVDYAAKELEFDAKKLPRDPQQLSGFIKNRIAAKLRASPSTQTCSEVVANFVRSAPPRVFKNWLQNPAFSAFYDECRRIASLYDCDTSNER